jgi:hypothetical protein
MGGGGAFGIAFHLGVTHALIDAGVRVDEGPMLGVSAGAYTAAALVTGTSLEAIMDSWASYESTKRRGRARTSDITGPLFGDRRDARVTGVSITPRWPSPILVSGAEHALSDVVAAAASPLGMAHGHRVAGRRLYDAGMHWNTVAHRAPRADLLLVSAALTGDHRSPMSVIWERQLRFELHPWHMSKHRHTVVIRPDVEVLSAGASRLGDMLNPAHAPATYRAAYRQGERIAPGIKALHSARAELATLPQTA